MTVLFLRFRGRHNVHELAAELAVSEGDTAVGKRKEGVVLANADVVAGVPARAALTHDNVAGAGRLAAEQFDAEALTLAVAAVAGTAACFLMCHFELLLFRGLLSRGLSRCSILCRRRLGGLFGRGLGRSGLFRLGSLVRVGLGLVRGCRARGLLLLDLRGCRRLARLGRLGGLGSRFGLRCRRLLLRLVVADRGDPQDRVLLPVTLLAAVIVAAALLEHRHLVALRLG